MLPSPEVTLEQEEDEIDLSGIGSLSQEFIDHIQMKAREKESYNRDHAHRLTINTGDDLFYHMYCALADFANYTIGFDIKIKICSNFSGKVFSYVKL